jgi:hypothetical protein
VRLYNLLIAALLVGFMGTTVFAQELAPLVIGKDLKVGMPLENVIAKLGIPRNIIVNRGTEPQSDSIAIEYEQHGIVIHAMSRKGSVEEIEVLPNFKGTFAEGIKLGAKFTDLIGKYGMPHTLSSKVARYPETGMYFVLEKEVLVSAKVFARNSKILDLQMINKQ